MEPEVTREREHIAGGPVPAPKRQTGLLFLGVLVILEIGVLYLLITVETPLSPVVGALLRNGFGIFALVMLVVTVLGFTVSVVLRLMEGRRSVHSDTPPGAS